MSRFLQTLLAIMAPVFVMILLIPLIHNDLMLALVYAIFSLVTLVWLRERRDVVMFVFGLVVLTVAEVFFVSTGAETFHRTMLIAGIPIWLPIIWGYSFVMIRRGIVALDTLVS